jgi:hypothetical protein
VAAASRLQAAFGTGLTALDPESVLHRAQAAVGTLAGARPADLLPALPHLPAVVARLDVRLSGAPAERSADAAALRLRGSAVVALTADTGELLRPWTERRLRLLDALARQLARVDLQPASAAFAAVATQLDRVLPPVLRAAAPLDRQQVLDGLAQLRPSRHAAAFDAAVTALTAAAGPATEGIAEVVDAFVAVLHDVLDVLDPGTLRDPLSAVQAALRTRTAALDPAAVGAAIDQELLEPVRAALGALDPDAVAAGLRPAFERARDAVTGGVLGVLDDLTDAVDVQLHAIREEVHRLVGLVRSALDTVTGAVEAVAGRLEDLVFTDLLGRLSRLLDTLGTSFDAELDRVRVAFDAMLAAIPTGQGPPPAEGGAR